MKQRVLITGSAGVIGQALRASMEAEGHEVVGLDLRGPGAERADVRDSAAVERAVEGCTGIVHLAAVSRVVWGERDPATCLETNVGGTRHVIAAALERAQPPWLVFGSSREVYGQSEVLPVTEDMPIQPVNVYGYSKAEGEDVVLRARERGLRAAILRFSNVYGCTSDHADRVIPAFARAALAGSRLSVHGAGCTFDFTHLEDTVRGISALCGLLSSPAALPPPIHLTTGVPTTLGELARLAVELSATAATLEEAPARGYDVAHFVGDPARARALLDWSPRVSLREGLGRLIDAFRRDPMTASTGVNAS